MVKKSCAWTHFDTPKTPTFQPSKRRMARARGSKRCSFFSSMFTDRVPVQKNTISPPKTAQKWFRIEDRMQKWQLFWTFELVTQDHIFKSLKYLGRSMTKTVILTFFDRRLWVEVSKHVISDSFQFYQRGRIFHACPRRAILAVCGPA